MDYSFAYEIEGHVFTYQSQPLGGLGKGVTVTLDDDRYLFNMEFHEAFRLAIRQAPEIHAALYLIQLANRAQSFDENDSHRWYEDIERIAELYQLAKDGALGWYMPKAAIKFCEEALAIHQRRQILAKADEPLRKLAGYIYLILGPQGHYKIGLSKTPLKRIERLEVKLPFPIEPIHIFKTNWMRGAERELHQKYTDEGKHVNGEWFMLTDDDVQAIKQIEYYLACEEVQS